MSDAKEVLGLEPEYSSFRSVKPDRDGFEQMLSQILINQRAALCGAQKSDNCFCYCTLVIGKRVLVLRECSTSKSPQNNVRLLQTER
jgi:hypothetical protein